MTKPDPKAASMRMTNCHVHTFTTAHTPRYFPAWPVVIFRYIPGLVRFLTWASKILGQRTHDAMNRMKNFHRTGSRKTQEDVFREIRPYYPPTARFVVLPMDMALIGHGGVDEDIYTQHDKLADLAAHPELGPQVIPFATVFPDRKAGTQPRELSAADEFRRCVEDLGFRGLKLYPKLGFAPDHPVLMDEVYPLCVKHNIPVMTHCSRGGPRGKTVGQLKADRWTSPAAYEPVLKTFPDLRICLAHFGGDADWKRYLKDGVDPSRPEDRRNNWVTLIADMIRSGDYPNLWTDISYTIFSFNEYIPLLRLYLENPAMRTRVLFGSDFYMTRQESLSEKAISIRLRDALGEDTFRQIAETNPEVWLGERPPTP